MAPTLDPSWTPAGDLVSERTWLLGTVSAGFGYGLVVSLSWICLTSLVKSAPPSNHTQRKFMIVYVLLTFIFATLYFAGTVWMTQLSFIDFRLYPGGPAGFEVDLYALPVNSMATIFAAFANFLNDGLMCWRCIVMYSSSPLSNWVKNGIPIFLYISEVAIGFMWIIQIASPASSLWNIVNKVNFTPAYFGLGFGLHILATVAIVSRLLIYRRRISSALGKGHGTQYISMAAMIIESACLMSTLVILVLITFTINHPLQNLFLQFFGIAQMIPSLLIVQRVASGKAWTNQRSEQIMSTIDLSSRPVVAHRVVMDGLDQQRVEKMTIGRRSVVDDLASSQDGDSDRIT